MRVWGHLIAALNYIVGTLLCLYGVMVICTNAAEFANHAEDQAAMMGLGFSVLISLGIFAIGLLFISIGAGIQLLAEILHKLAARTPTKEFGNAQ